MQNTSHGLKKKETARRVHRNWSHQRHIFSRCLDVSLAYSTGYVAIKLAFSLSHLINSFTTGRLRADLGIFGPSWACKTAASPSSPSYASPLVDLVLKLTYTVRGCLTSTRNPLARPPFCVNGHLLSRSAESDSTHDTPCGAGLWCRRPYSSSCSTSTGPRVSAGLDIGHRTS